MGDDSKHIDSTKFCRWAKQNCPRVFDGIHCWIIKKFLDKGYLPGISPKVGVLKSQQNLFITTNKLDVQRQPFGKSTWGAYILNAHVASVTKQP